MQQLGFGDGWISAKVGQNATLDRLYGEVKWYRLAKLLARLKPEGAGRPPYEPLLMLKALLLQQWYGLSDADLEEAINDAVTDLVSGERAVAIVPQGQTLDAKAKGNPVDVIYPTDGAVVLVGPVGILKEAPHPNAAKLFLNFMMSEEYSKLAAKHYEQPLRADVKVASVKPLTELKPVSLTPAEIKEGIPKIRDQWKDLFGA